MNKLFFLVSLFLLVVNTAFAEPLVLSEKIQYALDKQKQQIAKQKAEQAMMQPVKNEIQKQTAETQENIQNISKADSNSKPTE